FFDKRFVLIHFSTAQNRGDLEQILALQQRNLPNNISNEEAKSQGFVTVHHDLALLTAMNQDYQHVIAKADGVVIGYALVMLPAFGNKIPVLRSLFEKIETLTYNGQLLKKTPYFVMGQVCVDKAYRGKGIFAGLYQKMKKAMSPYFACIITEIATRNTRSMRAHEKVGFETIHLHQDELEEWAIVGWAISDDERVSASKFV
ncbi:MAG: GNAT family N-acetyltransferase, partial [Bacteroidota bacterium]